MELKNGDTFRSLSAVESAISAYEKINLANFIKSNSKPLKVSQKNKISAAEVAKFKYRALYYKCKYNGARAVKKGQSVRQSFSYKDGCGASFTVNYKPKMGEFVIADLCAEHNHDRSATIFDGLPKQRQLSSSEKTFVENIVKLKPNIRLLQKQVKEKTGKTLLMKDFHNLKQRTNSSDQNELQAIFDEVKMRNDVVTELLVTENELQGIYIQDSRMKRYFDTYPDILLMDATYKLNDRRMPLFFMLVIDGNGESHIAAMFVIKSENYDIVSKMFTTFKKHNPKHGSIKVILSDKNFADRRAYTEAFPTAQLQLCIFHVMQNFHREVSTKNMGITGLQKKQAITVLQKMMYAPTPLEYSSFYDDLVALNLEKLQQYFDKNWHPIEIRKQWAAHFTNNSQNYMNRTTNRLESINQKLKTVVTKYGTLHNFLKETLDCIQSLGLERDQRTIRSIHRKPVSAINDTPDEHCYRTLLTNFAFNKFLDEKKRTEHVLFIGDTDGKLIYKSHRDAKALHSMDAAGKTCSCPFFKMMALPCRHLIHFMEEKGGNLFAPNLCNQRWYKSHLPSDLLGDMNYIQKDNVLSQTEKFRKANETFTNISEILSEKSSPIFQMYMAELRKMKEFIELDKIFGINEIETGDNYICGVNILLQYSCAIMFNYFQK